MFKIIVLAALGLCAFTGQAMALSCSVPRLLENGTTADASKVMDNFNAVIDCINAIPAASPAGALSVTLNGDQSVPDSVYTPVQFNSVAVDTQSAYSPSTGHYTPTVPGKYLVCTGINGYVATALTTVSVTIKKDGTAMQVASTAGPNQISRSATAVACAVVPLNGATDWVEIDAYVQGTGGSNHIDSSTGGNGLTWFTAAFLGS